MSAEVWNTYGCGFGDIWSTLNWCLRRSVEHGPQRVSRWSGSTDMAERMREMLACLDQTACPNGVTVVDGMPTHEVGGRPWATKYLPTRQRWSLPLARRIAVQLDGRSSSELKNPPPDEITAFGAWAHGRSVPMVTVGLPDSLERCIDLLATSSAFVGVCSGMSHLAHSVGVPVFLVEYRLDVGWWHGPNEYTLCAGLADAQHKLDRYLETTHAS